MLFFQGTNSQPQSEQAKLLSVVELSNKCKVLFQSPSREHLTTLVIVEYQLIFFISNLQPFSTVTHCRPQKHYNYQPIRISIELVIVAISENPSEQR